MMITIRPLSSESQGDRTNVLRIYREAPTYTELVEGRPPSEEDVDDFFNGKPANKDAAHKSVFGFYVGPDMIGCADVIRSYPADDSAWVGLLLFSEKQQGRGHGKAALALIEGLAREWGYSRMQLGAISTNPRAFAFWQREGFREVRRLTNPRFIGEFIVMERPIE